MRTSRWLGWIRLRSVLVVTTLVSGSLGFLAPASQAVPLEFEQVAAGKTGAHTCALVSDGSVRCWGWNGYGQLGNGTITSASAPVGVLGITDAVQVSAGAYHSCARLSGGGVKCWGVARHLGYGNTSTAKVSTPVVVSGISNAIDLSVGGDHTCALLSTGTVKCWGGDGVVLGNSAASNGLPLTVTGLSGVVDVEAGGYQTCALMGDTTVRCWGENDFGQLGNGTQVGSVTPVQVQSLSGVTKVAGGGVHMCAILSGGTVSCWGINITGEGGDGTLVSHTSPVAVTGLSGVTDLAAGGDFQGHTCAVIAGGAVSCWGRNNMGQLGNGVSGAGQLSAVPVPVSGLTGATQVSLADINSCAVVGAGITCWGSDAFGGLGHGGLGHSSVPVDVVWGSAPSLTLTSVPPTLTTSASSVITFTTDPGASLACSVESQGSPPVYAACTSPFSTGSLANGMWTFWVKATDPYGFETVKTTSWTVDTTAPDTTILTGPSGTSAAASATFTFSSTESPAHFSCQMDGGSWVACSPASGSQGSFTVSGLSTGSHTFQVRAFDDVGNTDATPASRTWTIATTDTTAPETTIDVGPSGIVTTDLAVFSFSATETATFRCALDATPFKACTSPKKYKALAQGSHTFQVRATDAFGILDQTPAVRTWSIDSVIPDTSILSAPSSPTASTSASVSFSATETAEFRCALDSTTFTPCTTPLAMNSLAPGWHAVAVRAVDPVGNIDGSPAVATWFVSGGPADTSTHRPDVLTASPKAGNNIYDPTGASELANKWTVPDRQINTVVTLQNDGTDTDTYTILGNPTLDGGTLTILDPSGGAITGAVLAGTYQVIVPAGSSTTITLRFKSGPSSSLQKVKVSATSVHNPAVSDMLIFKLTSI